MRCDLCGKTAKCVEKKHIEDKDFEICECCWQPLSEKLSGKCQAKGVLEEVENMKEYEELVY